MAASIIMRKCVLGGSAMASIPFLMTRVQAGTEGKYVKLVDLPIYGNPADSAQYEYTEEKPNALHENISAARKWVWEWWDACEDTINYVQGKYDIGASHTRSTLDYLQNDPSAVPRASAISLAGLGGFLVATVRRGGVPKKLAYPTLGVAAMASLCYPRECVDTWRRAYDASADLACDSAEQYLGLRLTRRRAPLASSSASSHGDDDTPAGSHDDVKPALVLKSMEIDLGQSNKEDKDLYSNKSS
ncbi:PREDICTED: MICOS complex subunit Mic26-like [Priapulus caudatus]|uniref:MICOS complex subunit n=1 Tax=Priapulus caudatus TaxID=37621 RepID=A0ABM1DRJ0_PRICU|nr:PREDICTED: MICOS complex subunit Mic26-like [Priapulus caudatus]XP_014662546.1 PREDICTED: MICOS complex subunit Mic26-like [Priapulus caudatus]XP_014662553.1 PREDICTED: MICOS complex subunit Mic26-like [Priapulus caudatus]XP_014662561.1 PREDICTED: MICOS complex subunit Mic26-like [Priapulus caudatus]